MIVAFPSIFFQYLNKRTNCKCLFWVNIELSSACWLMKTLTSAYIKVFAGRVSCKSTTIFHALPSNWCTCLPPQPGNNIFFNLSQLLPFPYLNSSKNHDHDLHNNRLTAYWVVCIKQIFCLQAYSPINIFRSGLFSFALLKNIKCQSYTCLKVSRSEGFCMYWGCLLSMDVLNPWGLLDCGSFFSNKDNILFKVSSGPCRSGCVRTLSGS